MSEVGTFGESLHIPTTEQNSLNEIFSVPLSEERLEHWARLDFWTPAEAAAIVMEKDPRTAQWNKIRGLSP